MPREFKVIRARWLRGGAQETTSSYLLNAAGGKCCVGFYLSACGVPDAKLMRVLSAERLDRADLPDEAAWLVEPGLWLDEPDGKPASRRAIDLYKENDSGRPRGTPSTVAEQRREDRIAALFAGAGVTVTFE